MKMEMKAQWSRWCDHAIMKGSVTTIYQGDSGISAEIDTIDGFSDFISKEIDSPILRLISVSFFFLVYAVFLITHRHQEIALKHCAICARVTFQLCRI